jgi:glutathione S-transferase
MYTLYYMPAACSMAVHVILNEINQPVKLEFVGNPGESTPPPEAFLKVNPRGVVPTLVDDGFVLREGAAIITYLLDKHKSPLLPTSGKERATAMEWLMFCNATLHPAYGKAFFALKNFTGDMQDKVLTVAVEQINKLWKDVEERLEKSPYLAGSDITAADILLTVIGNWASYLPKPVQMGPNVKKMFKNVISRPSYQKALTTEKVEYKAAA